MAATTNRSYSAGHFLFKLDDDKDTPATSWLKSVDGGYIKGSVVTEDVGPDHLQFKHVATLEIEPLQVELALSATSPVLRWIQRSWKKEFVRYDGSVSHADFYLKERLRQNFYEALISETTFPTLDASSKEAAYMTVKIHPERVELEKGDETIIQGVDGANKAKMWLPSMFELHIEGVDCTHVNKIDGFSVKQKIKTLYTGSNRYPELEPTGIEFPQLSLTMSAAYADDFIKWHKEFLVNGSKDDTQQEKQGWIDYLDPSTKKPIFTIFLNNIGMSSMQIEKSEANAESIKRCKVELYVEDMELELADGLE